MGRDRVRHLLLQRRSASSFVKHGGNVCCVVSTIPKPGQPVDPSKQLRFPVRSATLAQEFVDHYVGEIFYAPIRSSFRSEYEPPKRENMETSTRKKLQGFGSLNDGWGFGEGVAFQPQVLNKASQLVRSANALGFEETDAFPGLNGEIMVTLYSGQHYWEFTIEADESVTFVYEVGNETRVYEDGLPFEFAVSMITNIGMQNKLPIFGKPAMVEVAA